MVAGYCFVQMAENTQDVSSATEQLAAGVLGTNRRVRLRVYVTINGAHNLTKVSPVTGNG